MTKDQAIVARWKVTLAARQKQQKVAAAAAARYTKLARKYAAQVVDAKKIIARHSTLPTRMFDAITVQNIPQDAEAVAGYVGGNWPTFKTLLKLFPHARHVSIAINAAEVAQVLDIEAGDATIAEAAPWVKRMKARGHRRPGLYVSLSQARALLDALAAAGIKRADIKLWIAHYTDEAHICGPQCGYELNTTADAAQFTDKSNGLSLDESALAKSFWE